MTILDSPPAAPPLPPIAPMPAATSRSGRALVSIAWAAVGGAVVVALWQLLALRTPDLPGPVETVTQLGTMLSDPFYDNGPNDKGIALQLLVSLRRVFTGFIGAAVVGIPFGLALGASTRAWRAANPIVQVLRPVSPLAWFPIWLTVLKDAGGASIAVIFITALWPIVLNTAAGAASVPADHRNVARVFTFGKLAYLRHVLVPDTLPSIVTGLRLSMGIAWMVIVAVEMLSGGTGIGFFVWDSYNAGNLAAVVAAIVIIGGIGVSLDTAFLQLGKRVAIEEARS